MAQAEPAAVRGQVEQDSQEHHPGERQPQGVEQAASGATRAAHRQWGQPGCHLRQATMIFILFGKE